MDKQLLQFHVLLVAILLLSGCSTGEGVTALMFAAKEGNEQQVAELLDRGAKVDRQSQYGWTALIFAAHYGHIEIVKRLLQQGADINHTSREIPVGFMATRGGYDSTTALREAIRKSHLDIAHLLLYSGAQASYEALDEGGASGDVSLVKKMLKQGLSVNDIPEKVGRGSPLNSAARAGDMVMIRYLLDQSADVNLRTWTENTPLTSAINSYNPDAVKLLLEEGADPNLPRTRSGNFTPLYEAIYAISVVDNSQLQRSGMYEIIKLLLQYGVDDMNTHPDEYQIFISRARKNIVRYLEFSKKQNIPEGKVENYKEGSVYWEQILELLEKNLGAKEKGAELGAQSGAQAQRKLSDEDAA